MQDDYGVWVLGKAMVEQAFDGKGEYLSALAKMKPGESITLTFTRTDAEPWMGAPGQKLTVEEVDVKQRESDWQNLAMLYRRKIARVFKFISHDASTLAYTTDKQVEAGIAKFEAKLGCGPKVTR